MITIIINNEKEEINVEQNKKSDFKKIDKKMQPSYVYEFELANHLLSEGYIMKKIVPDTVNNEGFVFIFYNAENIRQVMGKWNKERNKAFETQEIINGNEVMEESE